MLLSALTVLASAGLSAAATQRRSTASAWTSTDNGSHKLSSYNAPVLGGGNPGLDNWEFTIKESQRKQEVKGFGAAVTDGTVTAFNQLPANVRDELLRDIMGPSGLNFNLMRHTIASSDLSAPPAYTYEDNQGGFYLGDRGYAMTSMLAEMRRLQPNMTLMGAPWAPPAWMQLDRKLTGGTDRNNLDHAYEKEFADYFVKYLQEYERQGAHVDYISIQNEPFNSKGQMPTMYIYEDESAALIRDHVGPAIRNAGLNTKVWALDHNTNMYSYAQKVVQQNPGTVSAAAWHCYSGNDGPNWQPLTRFHNEFPNTEQYMTECWTALSATNWEHTSNFNMFPLQNWANGIIAWALGSYHQGGPALPGNEPCGICTGLVTIDANAGTYHKEVDYYMMGQFSRFIPKGAHVVEQTGSYIFPDNTGLLSVATVNPDNSRTVVIQNRYDHDIFVMVHTEREGQPWSARVPGKSTTTWTLP